MRRRSEKNEVGEINHLEEEVETARSAVDSAAAAGPELLGKKEKGGER